MTEIGRVEVPGTLLADMSVGCVPAGVGFGAGKEMVLCADSTVELSLAPE